jgi:hypothetical protein
VIGGALRGRDERFQQALNGLGRDAAPTWLDRVMRKKVVLHTLNDQSIEGVLMEQTVDGVILRASVLLGSDGKRTTMAGEVFVPRENIAFAQLDE